MNAWEVDYLEKDDVDVVKGALQHLAGLFGSLVGDAPAEKKRRCLPDLVKALSEKSKPDKNTLEYTKEYCEYLKHPQIHHIVYKYSYTARMVTIKPSDGDGLMVTV